MERTSNLRELASVPCSCGGNIGFCTDEDGDAVVIHTMPFCEWFEKAEIEDYRNLLDAHPVAKRAVMNHRNRDLS